MRPPGGAACLQQQGARPHRPVAAVAGSGVGQLALGPGGGLLGVPQVAAVQGNQRPHGLDQHEAVALTGLGRQLQRRLEPGDGVVPLAGQEALHRQEDLVQGKRPVHAELLADPPALLERGPGVPELVQLQQDASAH